MFSGENDQLHLEADAVIPRNVIFWHLLPSHCKRFFIRNILCVQHEYKQSVMADTQRYALNFF